MFGGQSPVTTSTEGWDGTNWSTRPNMGTAASYVAGGGTSTLALKTGGTIPPGASTTATEEFTGETETVTARTLTTS